MRSRNGVYLVGKDMTMSGGGRRPWPVSLACPEASHAGRSVRPPILSTGAACGSRLCCGVSWIKFDARRGPRTLLLKCRENPQVPGVSKRVSRTLGVYPPLGLAYIAAYLRQNGYSVGILDANAWNLDAPQLGCAIREFQPDVVGLTSMTIEWHNAVAAARIVKAVKPDTLVVVGGPQLSAYPQECLSFDAFDVGVIGDGERTMLEIVERVGSHSAPAGLPGTVWRESGGVRIGPPGSSVERLDDLPFPAVDLLPLERYRALTVSRPFLTMVSSRGCPFHCHFCSQVYTGNGVRLRSAENIVAEMEHYVRTYDPREIIMFDETFTLDRARILRLCELMREKGFRFRWNIRTRVDCVDEEMLRALKSAGCYSLHMGVESGSPEILQKMNKGITIEQAEAAFRTARKLGFIVRGYFMTGYLGETLQTYRKTVEFAKKLDLDWVSFTTTVPLPKSALYDEALRAGVLAYDYWREFTLMRVKEDIPHFTTPQYDYRHLKALTRRAYWEFYLRPRFIIRKLRSVTSLEHFLELCRGARVLLHIPELF